MQESGKKNKHVLEKFRIDPLTESSRYVIPLRISYERSDYNKGLIWDGIKNYDAVGILILNRSKNEFILVKQFRPFVFYCKLMEERPELVRESEEVQIPASLDPDFGFTLELCAGLVDKSKSIEQIAVEEVREECGYEINVSQLKFIARFRQNVGLIGGHMTIFFCEVTDDQRDVQAGGGLAHEGEFIDIVNLPVSQIDQYLDTSNTKNIDTSFSMLYALMWYKQTYLSK